MSGWRQLRKSRLISHAGQRAAEERVETRTGIIWQILPDQRLCRVKVQGIDLPIPIRYPETWRDRPAWCKVKAAVTIRHISGNRHRMEVIGPALTIPTPELGAEAEPDMALGKNCVISGCEMYLAGQGMHVYFVPGVYRISDVYYDLPDNWVMGDSPNLVMDASCPIQMGNVADVFEVSAAHATNFRMDAWYAGIDGLIDYVVGTPSVSIPEIPAGPAGHVKLTHLLVPPGTVELTRDLINATYSEPIPAFLDLDVEKYTLEWADSSITITAEVLDQYSRPFAGDWTIRAIIVSGSGSISGLLSTEGGSTASFTYYRPPIQGWDYESCPVYIDFYVVQRPVTKNSTALVLEDELGGIIIPDE